MLAFKPKENAVKQELEKLSEQSKAVVKVSVAFNKALGSEGGDGSGRAWKEYFEYVKKEFPNFVKQAQEEESRDR